MSTIDVLNEVAEFLQDYSDVRDGDDGAPVPNRAMSLLCEVEREIEKLESRAVKVDPAAKSTPPEGVSIRERIRMALDSREFYELSQAYRHSQEWHARGEVDINPVVVAWEALKQYVIDNADPSCPPQPHEQGGKNG